MARTYTIRINRVPFNEDLTEVVILELMREICLDELYDEAYKICGISRCECGDWELNDMVDAYKTIPSEDLTIRFREETDCYLISQTASGGGGCRDMKEACRKAFILLFLKKLWEHEVQFRIEIS